MHTKILRHKRQPARHPGSHTANLEAAGAGEPVVGVEGAQEVWLGINRHLELCGPTQREFCDEAHGRQQQTGSEGNLLAWTRLARASKTSRMVGKQGCGICARLVMLGWGMHNSKGTALFCLQKPPVRPSLRFRSSFAGSCDRLLRCFCLTGHWPATRRSRWSNFAHFSPFFTSHFSACPPLSPVPAMTSTSRSGGYGGNGGKAPQAVITPNDENIETGCWWKGEGQSAQNALASGQCIVSCFDFFANMFRAT